MVTQSSSERVILVANCDSSHGSKFMDEVRDKPERFGHQMGSDNVLRPDRLMIMAVN